MPSDGRKIAALHRWTNFEMHTLLCLMAKGLHIPERGKRTDHPEAAKKHAYLEFATALNSAVHEGDFDNDIDKREVARMIDKVLHERKGVVGAGGYMQRATHGRITRGLKRLWDRPTKFDYDGTESEWKLWRKDQEAERARVANGGPPRECTSEKENTIGGLFDDDDVDESREVFISVSDESASKAVLSPHGEGTSKSLDTLATSTDSGPTQHVVSLASPNFYPTRSSSATHTLPTVLPSVEPQYASVGGSSRSGTPSLVNDSVSSPSVPIDWVTPLDNDDQMVQLNCQGGFEALNKLDQDGDILMEG